MDILKEIKSKAEKEKRTPVELYAAIKQMGAVLFFSKSWTDEQIASFCGAIVALRNMLVKPETE